MPSQTLQHRAVTGPLLSSNYIRMVTGNGHAEHCNVLSSSRLVCMSRTCMPCTARVALHAVKGAALACQPHPEMVTSGMEVFYRPYTLKTLNPAEVKAGRTRDMAQTNSNKRAETELVLAASIQRLLDKTVRAMRPTHPFGVLQGSGRMDRVPQEGQMTRALGLLCDCGHDAALAGIHHVQPSTQPCVSAAFHTHLTPKR